MTPSFPRREVSGLAGGTHVADWDFTNYDYQGPSTVIGDTTEVTEARIAGDFEAVLTWVVGLRTETPFRVMVLDSPPRLVIDFQH